MSRIANIEPIQIAYPDLNDFGTVRRTVLVKVTTDDGVVGWGECIAMWPEACKATRMIITEGLLPTLKGDAVDTAKNWEKMRRHVWWYGEGGIASLAISGVDMALWDIAGKRAGKPLYELFGGLHHMRLPANASSHVNKNGEAACVAEVDISFIRALRAALGEDAGILVDIGNGVRWDVDTAIDVANRMYDLGVGWYEEPLYPTDDAGYKRLAENTKIRIASGEREFTEAGYRRQMELGAVEVYGVDPARVEGITGFRRVDALASQYGKVVNAHAWSTAITSAASLHLSLASPNTEIFEFKPFDVVVQTDLVAERIWHSNGYAYPLEGAGLGIEVQEDVVKRLTEA